MSITRKRNLNLALGGAFMCTLCLSMTSCKMFNSRAAVNVSAEATTAPSNISDISCTTFSSKQLAEPNNTNIPDKQVAKNRFLEVFKKCFTIDVKGSYEFAPMEEGSIMDKTNVKDSGVRVQYKATGFDLNKFLSENYGISEKPKNEVAINFRFSTVPFLLDNYTRGRVEDKVDHKLALAREDYQKLTTMAVTEKIKAANPQFDLLPATMQDQIVGKVVGDVMVSVDNQLAQVKAAKMGELNRRIDELQLETSIQELALNYATTIGNGDTFLFFRGGKMKVDGGLANSTTGTGALNAGIIFNKGDYQIRLDAYFYHQRLAFMSAHDSVANIGAMSQESFDNYSKWWKIDSAMFKALVSSKRGEVYLTLADSNGKFAIGAGLMYKITDKDIITIDVANNPNFLDLGARVFVVHKFGDKFSVYGGLEFEQGRYRPLYALNADGRIDSTVARVGAEFVVYNKHDLEIKLTAEASKLLSQAHSDLEDTDFSIGTEVNWSF